MRLIGDIGGTNARFALADKDGNILELKNYLKKDYASVADAINNYKKSVKFEITEAVIAVNAPIVEGRPFINSNNWGYDSSTLEQDIGFEKIYFFNDLQAHAMSLPFLKEEEKVMIHGKKADKEGTIAVIGPGTGLGMAYGIYDKDSRKHKFYPSEGGNQVASPVDKKQAEFLHKMMDYLPFVRWEDVSSGRGIRNVYNVLWGEDKSTEIIMQDFVSGEEKSRKTFGLFCDFLGAFAHNVGTIFLPSGGMYIIGGILTRKENIDFLVNETKFLEYYYSKKIYQERGKYLSEYPIYLITHFNPALLGLANYKIEN